MDNKEELILWDKDDFEAIKSMAHRSYLDQAYPKHVGQNLREISSHEANVMVIIEATINYLKMQNCLITTPKFDYRERKK